MKVAIIGSGPAALMCAINCNCETHIFTRDDKLGKKILVTGNGRCNLTNTKISQDSYNKNLSKFFDVFDNTKTIQYFNKLGLVTYEDEENRVYPISNSAQSVVDVLQRQIANKNIVAHFECEIESIEKLDSKFMLNDDKSILFDKVVICTGSTDKLLNKLGVKYKPFSPSLVALKTKENTKRLSGIKLSNISVKMALNGNVKQEYGEVLFKDNGISGICIFNLSAHFARQQNYCGKVIVNLLPKLNKDELCSLLFDRLNFNYENATQFMQGLFHKEVNKYLLKVCNICEENQITKSDISKLAQNIQNLTFNVCGTYDNNQVNCGGVELANLTDKLMSKQINNLYFAGEVVDVDGLCGGYNLQWCWTSGKIVGDNL